MKLGRLPAKPHSHTLQLGRYLTGELPSPAEKVWREYAVPASAYQMYGNAQYGDCVWAAAANLFILDSVHAGKLDMPTEEEVLAGYSAVTGFDPATGANDNGTSMTDALAYLQSTGLGGRKILGWAAVKPEHRKIACDLFGSTYVGVNLPESAQSQFGRGPWEVVPNSPIEGGHCILRTGYGSDGDNYVTWADWTQKASNDWSSTYVDEEYAVITQDWLDYVTEHNHGSIDLATLQSDLKNL